MIRMIQRRLIIPRGDTGSFSIPYLKAINPGDVAVFTIFDIRTKTKMYQKLIAAEGDILNIAFTHGDTVNLKPGKYLWDIKFYTNPRIVDDELVDGDEVDSYYAGFSLPECEIRETGDALLTSDDAPTSTISPESLNIINAAINEILITKKAAVEAAETASSKADAAAESAEDASDSAAVASQSAALAEARVNEIENLSVEVDTGLEGTDANVTYTPSTGVLSFIIPRGNTGNGIASCVLNNDFTLTINYTNGNSTTTIPIRGDTPHLTIGEVTEGPHAIATITGTDANPILNLTLPNANVPTKLSQLTDDIGVAGKANSADLAAVATSGNYTDLENKPYIPVKTSDLTNDSNYAVDSNYIHTDNNYTTAEKNKLEGIAAGAEVNVNADWNASSGDAQILNKPTNVSAFTNDAGYLTQHQDISGKANSADLATVATSGSYNDLLNKPFIPSAVSDLTDDSGHYIKPVGGIPAADLAETYLTSFTETDPTVPSWAKQPTKPSYTSQEVGALPADTYIPQKTSDLTNDSNYAVDANYVHTDNNYTTAEKNKLSGIAAGAEVNVNADWNAVGGDAQILNKPTKVSAFTNDTGYLTQHQDISGKADKSEIPIKISQLQNDSGYLTSFTETDPTVPAWAKAAQKPSYTAAEVGAPTVQEMAIAISTAIGNVHQFDIQIVQALPTENIQEHTIYFVPKTGETNDVYDEYIYVNNTWEMIGNTQIDLSNYATKSEIPEVPVQDVQVNGTSVVQDGVANVPLATSGSFGVIKTYTGVGLYISGGTISVADATEEQCKAGTNAFRPIVPERQHNSTFYGLAKAAGHDEKTSTEALGTYTPEAKGAIQSMLGVSDLIATAENNLVASKAYNVGDVFTANGKLYKATAAIAADAAIIPAVEGEEIAGANCEETSVGDRLENGWTKDDFKFNALNGITINNAGYLTISPATGGYIKNGFSYGEPITPNQQHTSTFYGLAKAAGADEKDSTLPVGQYTDTAKAAIKNMLGITHTLTLTVLTQDNVTVTGQIVTVRANDVNGEVYATAMYNGQPVSFSVPDGFSYYVSVSDTLDHHFNPTTASGIVSNTDIAVTLQYSDFSTIQTAVDIKAALNAGIDLTDLVGEQITCSKGSDTLTWDVVDYDETNKNVTLLLHDVFGTANMQFEPVQALMWCENGLAAGSYTFTWQTTQCYFTLTTAIPAGGQLRATNSQFQTYASQDATEALETGTVGTEEIAGATDLGHEGQGLLNHRDRVNSGSNNFAESALFWWLNSDAAASALRVPVTKFSRAYSYAQPGFMNGLDANFVNCLDEVNWLCSTNNVYECPESLGGYTKGTQQAYTVKAKFGLASEMEIFGSYGGNADGSKVFDLYSDATAEERKKYRGTSAQNWWLRSPSWNSAYNERTVYSSGAASGYGANGSCAVVPACRISRTVE